jgi:F-type H+-transporting ATPase subunit gamma
VSDTSGSLRRKIKSAGDLQSVVRAMKALAASSVGQYENAVRALADYSRTVELGLSACLRSNGLGLSSPQHKVPRPASNPIGAVVFGSDQGLVGQFNEVLADVAMDALAARPGDARVWAVGERIHARLLDAGLPLVKLLTVPSSVETIGPLVGQILLETETHAGAVEKAELHLFYNRPSSGALYAPATHRLLPLDEAWRRKLVELPWPNGALPEVPGANSSTLRALIREHLFITIFRACAESLASENSSRLAAMQRADKNIDDLLEQLNGSFHRLRQSSIDAELFDVISGVEALSSESIQ